MHSRRNAIFLLVENSRSAVQILNGNPSSNLRKICYRTEEKEIKIIAQVLVLVDHCDSGRNIDIDKLLHFLIAISKEFSEVLFSNNFFQRLYIFYLIQVIKQEKQSLSHTQLPVVSYVNI